MGEAKKKHNPHTDRFLNIYKDLYLDEIFATYFEAIKYCNIFSRLKVLTFINGKKNQQKEEKNREKNPVL